MVEFVDASIEELAVSTAFIRKIRPDLKGMAAIGIQKAKPGDQSVVFHLKQVDGDDSMLYILSVEFITEHPFFKD